MSHDPHDPHGANFERPPTTDGHNISYQPSEGLTYDPNEAKYWDPAALKMEIERAFEICHGCRMCFKYCDSFPSLFKLIDDTHGGDVRKLSPGEIDGVMDQCFQCKLCEVQCPYTPRDKHEFQLDFPKLVHRYQAVRKKREGFTHRWIPLPGITHVDRLKDSWR